MNRTEDERRNSPVLLDARVQMRDGVELSADVYLPSGRASGPAIVLRTPYDNASPAVVQAAQYFCRSGFAFAACDVRGRGDSGGRFDPFRGEGPDGYDTIEWVARQEWCDGNVGTMGASYACSTQWWAARLRPPHLRTMVSTAVSGRLVQSPQFGGKARLSFLPWIHRVAGHTMQPLREVDGVGPPIDWAAVLSHRPLASADGRMGRPGSAWSYWMRHAADPDFWATESLFQNYEQLAIPVLHITGWYDGSLVAELELFEAMRRLEGVEAPHYLVVGPWDHPGTSDPSRTLEPLDFGAGAVVDIRQLHARWFDYWLRGRKAEKLSSSVRIFAMGLDQWSDHGDWPTSDTSRLELYLHSGGDANSSSGGGTLDVRPPGLEDDDTYLYDPSDPTPSAPSVEAFVRASGPLDYLERSFVESRRDVLVYTTAPLETPITLIGAPVVELCSSSDAVDTDFGASLGYVGSDGRSIILAEGLLRTSFSESASSLESALPGSPGVYRIVLNPTCRQVLTGERIRVCIYSAAFPAYDRNPNTGGVVGRDEVQQLAHQRVRHSRGAVSKVVLRIGHIVGGRTTFAAGQEEWPWLRGRATLPGPTIESETAGG